MATKAKPVLVTTEHRGVFFGYLTGQPKKEAIRITDARNVVSWTSVTKGFLGLAADGPGDGCRIGPKVAALRLYDITSVVECSDEAVARFEAAPWA